MRAVSFDFGQTLASLDPAMLSARLRERGVTAEEAAIDAALPEAWAVYDRLVQRGVSGHPWKQLMSALLRGAGAPEGRVDDLAEWLWSEQPRRNLWRRPIPGMFALCEDLDLAGVPLGVLSNSEGRLRELIEELGWQGTLRVVADSGVLGVEKPDPRIFTWLSGQLGVATEDVVHVGDSLAADVRGAVGAGMRAVWFSPAAALPSDIDPTRVKIAADAPGLRAALAELGVPGL